MDFASIKVPGVVLAGWNAWNMIKCFAPDSLSNYTQSCCCRQQQHRHTRLHRRLRLIPYPLLESVFRLAKTTAQAARFCSSFPASSSSSSLCRLLPSGSVFLWPIATNSSARQTALLSGNNHWHLCIQDSARRPSVAAELAGVPAVSQSESDPDAPLFAHWEQMNEGAQWSPPSGFMTFFPSDFLIKEKNKKYFFNFCL